MNEECIFGAFNAEAYTPEVEAVFTKVFNSTEEELLEHIDKAEGLEYNALSLSLLLLAETFC
jgi:hypothetical protein